MVFMKGFVTGALVTAGTIIAAAAISVFRENRLPMINTHSFDFDYNTVACDTDASDAEQTNASESGDTTTVAETDRMN